MAREPKRSLFDEMREAMGEKPDAGEQGQSVEREPNANRETFGSDPADNRPKLERRNLRLPSSHWRELERIATEDARPISEVIREAVREYLRERRRI